MLLFFLAGAAWTVLSRDLRRGKRSIFLMAVVLGPLLVGITGNMNIGLRHVLPIYPFLAMLAATAVAGLWQLRASPGVAYTVRAGIFR
jgi:hypothetical protein